MLSAGLMLACSALLRTDLAGTCDVPYSTASAWNHRDVPTQNQPVLATATSFLLKVPERSSFLLATPKLVRIELASPPVSIGVLDWIDDWTGRKAFLSGIPATLRALAGPKSSASANQSRSNSLKPVVLTVKSAKVHPPNVIPSLWAVCDAVNALPAVSSSSASPEANADSSGVN